MTIYLNWDGPQGRETVDELTREPAQSRRDFRDYVRKMILEYALADMVVYQSGRCCKGWK